jgi:hypothetical protein
MSTGFNHLIAKHGILTSFSIARKVSKKDIKQISDKIKKKCKTKEEFNELLQKEVLKTTKYSMNQDLIPGLILPEKDIKQSARKELADEKKLMKLNYIANIIAKKLMDHKLSKDEICYIILTMLSSLGLNDQDFKNFNNKYGTIDENIEEDDDDSDDSF